MAVLEFHRQRRAPMAPENILTKTGACAPTEQRGRAIGRIALLSEK
jgi:hypothetical protein